MIKTETINKYIGAKYGQLTIKSFSRKKNKTEYFFNCLWDCGNEKEIRLSNLKLKTTVSCGCFGKEKRLKSNIGNTYNRKDIGVSSINALFRIYITSAKKRNYVFDLDLDFFKSLIFSDCYYCNSKPSSIHKAKSYYGEIKYNGIDRVNNHLGYTKDNCVACCKKCNSLKNSVTPEIVTKIYKFLFVKK